MLRILPALNNEPPESKLARSRPYIVAFGALWLCTQLAFLNPTSADGSREVVSILWPMALLTAATALWLRWSSQAEAAAVPPQRLTRRVLPESDLLEYLKAAMTRAHRRHESIGVMAVEVTLRGDPTANNAETISNALREAAEVLRGSFGADTQVYQTGRRLAVVISDTLALIKLKDLSDRLLAEAMARNVANHGPASFQLVLGVAVNSRFSSSARTMLSNANAAVDRAEALGTGCYFAVDGMPW
jgi:hypothetical protein